MRGRHGRDHRVAVWQLGQWDMVGLDASLPVQRLEKAGGREPWLLHSVAVNALNFCAFSICMQDRESELDTSSNKGKAPCVREDEGNEGIDCQQILQGSTRPRPALVAVPNALDSGGIDIFQLPSESRLSTIPPAKDINTGMVMALSIFRAARTPRLTVASGYESGHVTVHVRRVEPEEGDVWEWQKVLVVSSHSQPVLSLATMDRYSMTSSADARIAKFEIPAPETKEVIERASHIINTKHAGQQGLTIRSDARIFATAGWDARIRVYSFKTMEELAVLKWHKDGCYSVAFAKCDAGGTEHSVRVTAPTQRGPSALDTGSALDKIKLDRQAKAQKTHWLAAGGKDGKISLWDMY